MYPPEISRGWFRLSLMAVSLGFATQLSVVGKTGGGGTSSGMLLVANKGDHTLSLIDPVAGKEIATIPEDGVTGHEVIASPDGRFAYVPIFGNSGVGRPGTDGQLIRVMDLAKRQVVATVDFGKGVRPHCALIHPTNGRLYVTTEVARSVSIIDPKTLAIVGSVPTGDPQSHMLAISHDGRRGYTANVGSGTVSVLDLEANTLLMTIPVATVVQRISISKDDRWVFTADQTKPRLMVIDTKTNQVSTSIPLPGLAYGTACTPDGRSLVVALIGLNKVGRVDLATMKLVETLDLPKSPEFVLIRPDGAVAYVSCGASKQVAAIDLKHWKVEKLIEAGKGADGLAWAAGR